MRISMTTAACALLLMVPGLALAEDAATGGATKGDGGPSSASTAQSKDHAPMQGAGSVGESSATNGKTDNAGTAGHTGK